MDEKNKNYLFSAHCSRKLFWQQITFQKTFGGVNADYGRCVQQTSDGGYIITGYTQSSGAGDNDVYLIKLNLNGDTLWTKTFGRSDNDRGLFVRQTTDGGYKITGLTRAPGLNTEDIFLVKTDVNGDSLWTKTLGGTNGEAGTCVGGYIISGQTASFSVNHYDLYLLKTDASGNITWEKTYGGPSGDEMAYHIQQTADGGYIATGYYTVGNIIDLLLVRTNSSGDTLWCKTYGGAGVDQGLCVNQTSDGGFIVAGTTQSFGAGIYDAYLIKTDANGDTLWTKTYGGTLVENALSIQQTTDGGYIFSGNTTSFSPTGA